MVDATPEVPSGPPAPDDGKPAHRIRGRYASARTRGEALARRARDRFDRERTRRSWLETVWQSLIRMHQRGGPLLSGGLAYRIFLWELPMALVIVSVAGLVTDVSSMSVEQMAQDAGMSAALTAAIGQAVAQTEASAWWLLLLGSWLLLLAARSAVSAVRLICQIAWDEPTLPKVSAVKAPLIFSGVMLVAMVGSYLSGRLVDGGVVASAVTWVLVIATTFAVVVGAMVLLPRAGRPWPTVLPGAVLFTFVIRAMLIATQIYFVGKLDRVDDLYGSLGIAIVTLLWLYLISWGWIAATFINAGFQGVMGRTAVPQGPPQAGPSLER